MSMKELLESLDSRSSEFDFPHYLEFIGYNY